MLPSPNPDRYSRVRDIETRICKLCSQTAVVLVVLRFSGRPPSVRRLSSWHLLDHSCRDQGVCRLARGDRYRHIHLHLSDLLEEVGVPKPGECS